MSDEREPRKSAFYSYMSFLSPSQSHIQGKIWLILSAYKILNVTQISSMTKEVKSTISRELRQMEEEGLLISRIDENHPKNRIPPKLYSVNTNIPLGNPAEQILFVNPTTRNQILTLINRDRVIINLISSMLDLIGDIYQEIKELIEIGSNENFEKASYIYQKYLWGEDSENIIWFRFWYYTQEYFKWLCEFEIWLGEKMTSPDMKISEEELKKFQDLWEKGMKSQENTNKLRAIGRFSFVSNNKNIFRYHREEIKRRKSTTKKNYKKKSLKSDEILSSYPKLATLDKNGNITAFIDTSDGEKIHKVLPMFLIGNSEIKSKIWLILELYNKLNVTQISSMLTEVKSTISRHLNAMEEMGILESQTDPNPPPHRIASKSYRIRDKPNKHHARHTPFPHPPFLNYSLQKRIEIIKKNINEGISAIWMYRHLFALIEPIFQDIDALFLENTSQSEIKAKKIFQRYLCYEGEYQPIIMYHTRTSEMVHILAHNYTFFYHKMQHKSYSDEFLQEILKYKKKFMEGLEYDRDRSNSRVFGSVNIYFPRSIFEYYKDKSKI